MIIINMVIKSHLKIRYRPMTMMKSLMLKIKLESISITSTNKHNLAIKLVTPNTNLIYYYQVLIHWGRWELTNHRGSDKIVAHRTQKSYCLIRADILSSTREWQPSVGIDTSNDRVLSELKALECTGGSLKMV